MPKLQAAVPPGAPPNALLRVRLPDGNEVNVRVPKGLKPGDEFIFEVNPSGSVVASGSSTIAEGFPKLLGGSALGGAGTCGGNNATGKKGDKIHGNSKPVSKNPKKKSKGAHSDASHNTGGGGGGGGSGGVTGDSSELHRAGGTGEAPPFVTRFFNMYNQVYDILSQINEGSISPSSSSSSSRLPLQRKSSSNNNSNQPMSTFRPLLSPSSPSEMQTLDMDNDMDDALASTTTTISTSSPPRRLLDKEITSYEGLMISLFASTIIGLSILVGFLGGVLYVTPADDIIRQRW